MGADKTAPKPADSARIPLLSGVERLAAKDYWPPEQARRVREFCEHFLQRSTSTDKRSSGAVRQTFRLFGDKWITLVVLVLDCGAMRYTVLHKLVSLLAREGGESGISQRMLTLALHNLEATGMVRRLAQPGGAHHVEYELTPLGQSLHRQMLNLIEWAEQNSVALNAARTATGADADPALEDATHD